MAGRRRERKVVTVVFCDLVGFTARAESLDPEDVEAFLSPYHERVRAELERHGGTVEKFIGDAVMALFGAPTAHEDDPERAVRAALAIRDFALEEELELRVGITTGEALVRLDASPEAGEGMASGDVVNTAARLQSAAPINGVIVDETTFRATRGPITFAEAEPITAKGKAEPISVWQALQARARFGVDVAHEARVDVVGRERELTVLREAFARARHERVPQLVTLVGIPGIGKSRLVYELSRIADADPELITWRQGRCLAYGEGVTLWALGEIVKAQAGIVEQDTPDDVTARVRRSIGETLAGSGDEAWVESHLLALVGQGEEGGVGGDRRSEAFAAWRRYLEALADQRPLVLVFEDLHWADDALLDFVDELCDWVTDTPLLVVATARPELLERRPNWGGGKLNATTLALQPLSDEATAHLLGRLLGRPVLDADEQRLLLERAGGNPLYAEQFVDLFTERGSGEDLPLPETLQGIIAARLDTLAEAEKELLRDASVVGKVFWASAIAHRSQDVAPTLHSLERKGFLRRQKRSSVQGETELAFAHALVRDVAYGQIARADRAAKHRCVAEWIESLGRLEDHAELLAHHWRSALELTRATGADDPELTRRARLALRDAGDRAFALNAFSVAAAQYEDGLALWPDHDEERADLLFRRARALHHAYDEERRERALEDARDALLAAGDEIRAGEAEAFLARVAWDRGEGARCRARLARARDLVGESVSESAARVLADSARTLAMDDAPEEALAFAERAMAMTSGLGLQELHAHALTTLGMAKNDLDEGTGTPDIERALALALEIDSPIASAIVNNLAVQATIEGDLARADDMYTEALRLAERFGDRAVTRFVRGNRVFIDALRGRWDRALADADAFVAECEAGSPHTQEGSVRNMRAMVRAGRGDVDGAEDDLRRAADLTRDRIDQGSQIGALASLAAVVAEQGRIDEAREIVGELVPLVAAFGPHGALTQLALVADELGVAGAIRAALAEGKGPRALLWREAIDLSLEGEFARAADAVARTGAVVVEAEFRRRSGELLLASGGTAEGTSELERALAVFRSVGATRRIAEIERALAAGQSESA